MLFLLDNSESVGFDGFEKSKNFIVNVAEYFNPETTQVGIIEFAGESKLALPFAINRKAEQLKAMVNKISYKSGKEHSILRVYQQALSYFKTQVGEGRKVVLLITATEHTDITRHSAATILKSNLEADGAQVLVVGAGDNVSQDKLVEYSSGSRYTYKADNFDDIIGFVTKIRDAICK